MPSSVERIRQIRSKQEAQRKLDEKQAHVNQLYEKLKIDKEIAERKKQIEAKKQHRIEVGNRIINEAKIIQQLKEIEKHECSRFFRHKIFIDYEFLTKEIQVKLVWGNKFTIKNNRIDFEKRIFDCGIKDYYAISVDINIETEAIEIFGPEIPSKIWRANPDVISEQLAKSFIGASRSVEYDNYHSGGSEHSSGNAYDNGYYDGR